MSYVVPTLVRRERILPGHHHLQVLRPFCMLWRTKALCWGCSAFPSQTWGRKCECKETKEEREVQKFHYNHMWHCKILPLLLKKKKKLNWAMNLDKKYSSVLLEAALLYSMFKFCHLIGITYSFLSCPAKSLKCLISHPGKRHRQTTKLPENPPDYLPLGLKGIQWIFFFFSEIFFLIAITPFPWAKYYCSFFPGKISTLV